MTPSASLRWNLRSSAGVVPPVHDLNEMWFESPPRPTCVSHARTAEGVCLRCGAFQCDLCETPTLPSLCHACAVLVTTDALPGLSRRAAWKLTFLPLVGMACLFVLVAAKGSVVRSLEQDQVLFLSAWLIPFACGLGLVTRPWAPLAFIGSLVALALVFTALGPALVTDFTWRRLIDVVLLAAAPLAAVSDAFALDRAQRQRVMLEAMASA